MNRKQIIGLIAAALVFVFVGTSSVVADRTVRAGENDREVQNEFFKDFYEDGPVLPIDDFIGEVNVEGTIQEGDAGIFSSVSYNHEETLKYIEAMKNSDTNKGIILKINSPGGGVYESDELYLKLKEYKEETQRPVWVYMAQEACSGGYYISMAGDRICANRNCWTGSIGVIVSLTNLKDLYDKYGIKEENITSGPNKAMGSPGETLTDEQRKILQSLVDEAYDQFTDIVAEGRNMDINEVKKIADGRIYSAQQALDLKLIDEIGTYEDMKKEMKKSLGNEQLEIFSPDEGEGFFKNILSSLKTENTQEEMSDSRVIQEYFKEKGDRGLMYYAGRN